MSVALIKISWKLPCLESSQCLHNVSSVLSTAVKDMTHAPVEMDRFEEWVSSDDYFNRVICRSHSRVCPFISCNLQRVFFNFSLYMGSVDCKSTFLQVPLRQRTFILVFPQQSVNTTCGSRTIGVPSQHSQNRRKDIFFLLSQGSLCKLLSNVQRYIT